MIRQTNVRAPGDIVCGRKRRPFRPFSVPTGVHNDPDNRKNPASGGVLFGCRSVVFRPVCGGLARNVHVCHSLAVRSEDDIPGRNPALCRALPEDSCARSRRHFFGAEIPAGEPAGQPRGHSPTSMSNMRSPSIERRTAVRTRWNPNSPAAPGLTWSRS